jgi:FixJ family two-component response regulator
MDLPDAVSHRFAMGSCQDRSASKRQLLSVVIDDDESVRESLPDLLGELGFLARAFSSAKEFLSSGCVGETDCLILDIAMPNMSGPELQQELKRSGREIPTIFITGQEDDTIRTQVLNQGAAAFLLKPFSDTALIAAIKPALDGN